MRRVVVGNGDDGRSRILLDGPSPTIRYSTPTGGPDPEVLPDLPAELSDGTFISCGLWSTGSSPDPTVVDSELASVRLPGAGSTRWLLSVMGPYMGWAPHRTNTIDYGVVLSGAVDLMLEEDVVHLGPGDCVVIKGVTHHWRTGAEGCIKSTVIIAFDSSEPATVEGTGPMRIERD